MIINLFWKRVRNFQRFFRSFVRAKLSLMCRIDSEVNHELGLLRAATRKYHLQLCKIEKSKIPKLCHNKGFRSVIAEILVSVHSRKYFSFAATFPSRTIQGQANRLKIPLLYAHSLEIIKY